MSIQLIGVSHKTAALPIREKFAFSKEKQAEILTKLLKGQIIEECVILSTCNRTEIYTWCKDDGREREIYEQVSALLLKKAGVDDQADIGNIFRFYSGNKAIHHLFCVASGLDSMVMGEDQILGQVKEAHEFALQSHASGTYLNTLFRYAITAAKKVKTDTKLSTTPLSTAVLCIRSAEKYLGSLGGKNVMIIGASGKIGSVVFKNLQSDYHVHLYVTARNRSTMEIRAQNHCGQSADYTLIPYEKRYDYLKDMDVVISATSSPHYTLTYASVKQSLFPEGEKNGKPRAFMDLAVPMDIESRIGTLPGVFYSNIDDFSQKSKENQDIREKEAQSAAGILEEYEIDFEKWLIFQNSLGKIEQTEDMILEEMERKGAKKALDKFFYRVRETSDPKQLEIFMNCLTPEQWKKE